MQIIAIKTVELIRVPLARAAEARLLNAMALAGAHPIAHDRYSMASFVLALATICIILHIELLCFRVCCTRILEMKLCFGLLTL